MPPQPFSSLCALSGPIRGGLWMTLAGFCFAGMNVIIRQLSLDMHPFEVVFFRNLGGLAFMLPWLVRAGASALRTDHHRYYLGRSFLGFVSMLLWFSALAMMPVAEATALSFTSPLFATIFAVILLHEIVRARRWTATVIGFIGAMIILRPGLSELGLAHVLVLASSALAGVNAILVKQLTRSESANAIVTYMTLYIVPMSLIPALFVWTMPPPHTWLLIVLLGLLATIGHQAMTRAFVATETSIVMSFDYARLPFVAVIAWFAFGELPDLWTWVGAAVIVGASAYIAHREAAVARLRTHAAPAAAAQAADD
ncbi:MAG TPA: DMT family transporter [Alphaproteobacteria bacterium]|nr:DMT family transporter [Alphaproteobacteria bacterium]